MLTYRPVIFLMFAAPTLVMLLPLVAAVVHVVFGTTTDQHAILAIVITVLFSKMLESSITNAAPTKEIAIKSLERSRGWLFFAVFSLSILAIRLIFIPLQQILGLKPFLAWSPSLSISSALRLAFGGFLLGLSVVARYIGPQSINRCSSSPLLVNPYTRTFRTVFGTTRCILNAPRKVCQPDDTREVQLLERQKLKPRRLQQPTSATLVAQILISIVIGGTLALTSVFPLVHGSTFGDTTSSTIIFSCMTSSTIQLLFTAIQGTNHEINPTEYQFHNVTNQVNIFKSLTTVVPICYAILVFYVHFKSGPSQWSDEIVYIVCIPPPIIMYLQIFDHVLRIFMCKTPSNIKKFVEEASGGDVSMEIFIDVILRSLLHSDDELVKKLGNVSTKSSIWVDVEEEELKLSNDSIKKMANTLLHKTNDDEASPHLEDDILRLAILSCIGGSASKEEVAIGNGTESNIGNGLQFISKSKTCGEDSIDTHAVPIVRSLCVYIGGMGEALRLIVDPSNMLFHDEWVLPPGAVYACECALRGVTNWLIQSINMPRITTSVAILIPVLLNSAYKLEIGLLQHQKISEVASHSSNILNSNSFRAESVLSGENHNVKLFRITNPRLLPLFILCSTCAKMILEAAKSNEGFRRLSFMDALEMDCQKWLRSKISSD